VGYRNGKKAAEYALVTAGEAVQLKVIPDKPTASLSSGKIIHLEIDALDKNGNRVYFTNNEISVEVTGVGKLIGLDTGDQTSHELYKTNHRKLFEGKARAMVEAKDSGKINIRITSPGLKFTEINIPVEK
jgi:hypothetical protein